MTKNIFIPFITVLFVGCATYPVHQVIGDVPSKTGWTGEESFPRAEMFTRKPLDPGSVLIHTERNADTEFHRGVVSHVLELINGTSSGQGVLQQLRDKTGGAPIFIASANEKFFEGGMTNTARAVEVTGDADGEKSAVVYINTHQVDGIFKRTRVGTTPAKLMRQIVMETMRASQLLGRHTAGKLDDVRRNYTDELWARYEGDKFYGELTAAHGDGDAFNYLLARGMREIAFPGTDRNVLTALEQVRPDLRVPYLRAIRDADNLPGGVRLGFELFDSGGETQTPIRVALNVFDERHLWELLDVLNRHLPEGAQNDGNSITLIDLIIAQRRQNSSDGAMAQFAKRYQSEINTHPKAGRQELAIRVTQEIKRLVNAGAYTKQDVAELIAGLNFPSSLRKFFDDLLGDQTPRKPKDGPS